MAGRSALRARDTLIALRELIQGAIDDIDLYERPNERPGSRCAQLMIARLLTYPPAMVLRRPSGFLEPCQPSKVARPPSGPLWVHEIKHDGYRTGAYRAVTADTTPTATGFAHRIERRHAVGLCKEPKASCDGAGDGAVVHVDEREV